jgi:hypothetical protein
LARFLTPGDLADTFRPLPIGTKVEFHGVIHEGRKHARRVKVVT